MKPELPDFFDDPDEPASKDEVRAFALLILPIFEYEWERALTSPSPDWRYLASLHKHILQLQEGLL